MTFDQFFRILSARWLLAISVVAGITLLTLVICLLIPKSYKATASVMIDMKPDPVAGMNNMMVTPSASIMATQVDIITSPTVAMRVVRQVGMDSSDDVRKQWNEATGGKGDYLAWVGDLISKNLDVKPSRESNIIDITYSSVDPKFAAVLANAFAKAYMDSDVQFRVDPARQYYAFFEERARLAREKLEAAQTKLAQAQKDRGILVTDERLDHETAKLTELSTQIVALRAALADSSSRSAAAKNGADQMQDILNNPLISSLKSDLSRSEAKLEELSSHYGSAHPLVQETQANVDSIKERLALETRRLTKSLSINNSITQARQNEAEAEYEEQRAKLLKLKDARTELAVLEREVESAQHVYDAIQQRQSQMGLESNNNQNNVVLVTPATEPAKHYFPKITLSLALAMSLGSLISIIVVMGVQLFDRRIRGIQDLIQGTGLPVVGVIPHPSHTRWSARFRLTSKPVSSSVGLSVPGLSSASLESGRSAA